MEARKMANPTETQVEMHGYHSDVYKDVYNIRPRWLRPEDRTVEEWQVMIDRLIVEGQEMVRREQEEDARHATWTAEVTACEPLRVPFPAFKL
jgi:hypothetical protein